MKRSLYPELYILELLTGFYVVCRLGAILLMKISLSSMKFNGYLKREEAFNGTQLV